MAGEELRGHLDRSQSRGNRSQSQSWRLADTALSSFDSMMGERVLSRAATTGEWAILADSMSSLTPRSASGSEGSSAFSDTKKKVMVVVDASRESRLAMLWALSHMVRSFDTLTLIHVLSAASSPHKFVGIPFSHHHSGALAGLHAHNPERVCDDKQIGGGGEWRERQLDTSPASDLLKSLQLLCSSRRPEVHVEAMLVDGGDKGMTIVSQATKLEATVLVLGQKKPSLLQRLFNQRSPNDQLVDYCIQNAECLTLAVRKKNKHMGGYLINSRLQRNFWLLA